MDYLLARWFVIKNMDKERLKELHSFEKALSIYCLKNKDSLYGKKIFLPLWWQEGALFLRKEFKAFWIKSRQNPQAVLAFKKSLDKTLADKRLVLKDKNIFNDINFMHQCDLAVNASAAPASKVLS